MESDQVRGLAEAFDRDDKAHVSEEPANKKDNETEVKNFTNHVSLFMGDSGVKRKT